jgi:ADP-ribose pyrophosphatase
VAEFDGFTKQYLVSDPGERSSVLVTCGSYILLVRQYRLLIDDISLEIPGGKVDAGESPVESAIRECKEETGVECRNVRHLFHYHPGLDVTHNPTSIFYSDDVVPASVTRTGKSLWLPLDACLDLIFAGKIQDAMTIIAIQTYAIRRNGLTKEAPGNEINPEINPVCACSGRYAAFSRV